MRFLKKYINKIVGENLKKKKADDGILYTRFASFAAHGNTYVYIYFNILMAWATVNEYLGSFLKERESWEKRLVLKRLALCIFPTRLARFKKRESRQKVLNSISLQLEKKRRQVCCV